MGSLGQVPSNACFDDAMTRRILNDAEADEEGRRGTRKNIGRSLAVRENGSSIPASFCASCLLYTHANISLPPHTFITYFSFRFGL